MWLAFYRAGVSDGDFGSVLGREVAVMHKHGKMVARLHIISDGFVEHIFSRRSSFFDENIEHRQCFHELRQETEVSFSCLNPNCAGCGCV